MQTHVRHSPFTLLELLIAALAGAVLMAALVACLCSAWRLQEQGQARDAASLPLELARRRLTTDLAAAVPPAGLLAGPMLATTTQNGDWRQDDAQWVAAVGARNPDAQGGDLMQVHYYLTQGAACQAYQLVRTENWNLLATTETTPDEVVVLDNVVSFKATWYDNGAWQNSWDSTAQESRLPAAAWFRIDFAPQGTFRPPPLEVLVPLAMHRANDAETAP